MSENLPSLPQFPIEQVELKADGRNVPFIRQQTRQKMKRYTGDRGPTIRKGIQRRGHPAGPWRRPGIISESVYLEGTLAGAILSVEKNGRTLCLCQADPKTGKIDRRRKRCKSVREHFVRRALLSDPVLIALLRKIDPDLIYEPGVRVPSVINVIRLYRDSHISVEAGGVSDIELPGDRATLGQPRAVFESEHAAP